MPTNISKTKMTNLTKFFIVLFTLLFAIVFYMLFRTPANQFASLRADQVSIRQDGEAIQWKLLNGDWQTITTTEQLAGQQGEAGQPGKDGTGGENGKDGKNGADGKAGANGAKGAKGDTGATGAQGAKGDTGAAGTNGTNGTNGVDGAKGDTGATGAKGDTGAAGAAGTNGTNGREIELQKDLYYIQWRYVGEAGWRNLIAYSDLKGEKGDQGIQGLTGATGNTGPANSLSIGTVNRTACTPTATITGTAPSQTLNLGIPGLPTGGTTGQILQKNSNADCDAEWVKNKADVLDLPKTISGRWRLPSVVYHPGIAGKGLNLVPMQVRSDQQFDAIGITVLLAEAGINIRLAVYADNNGTPGDLIVDAGEVDCSTTGAKIATFPPRSFGSIVWLATLVPTVTSLELPRTHHTNNIGDLIGATNHINPVGSNITIYTGGYRDVSAALLPPVASGGSLDRWIVMPSLRGA